MQNYNDDTIKTSDTVLRKIYLSLYWKGSVWEGVGDRTELQHIDPHSIGHNSISFPLSWAAQPGPWGPSLSGSWFSLPHLISNSSDLQLIWSSCALSYIIVQRPPSSCGHHKLHPFNLSMVKVIFWYSSTGCTCYLHRCIFYFDSPTGSEVNIQQFSTALSVLWYDQWSKHFFFFALIFFIFIMWSAEVPVV